jgi:fibronectin type 3 domain-containing protein
MLRRSQIFPLVCVALLISIPLGCGRDGSVGCSSGEIGTIKLAWDPSTDPDVVGYKVYYGTAPRTYGPGIDVGNVTTYALTGLIKGQKYYITVTAYTKSNRESRFSNEVMELAK